MPSLNPVHTGDQPPSRGRTWARSPYTNTLFGSDRVLVIEHVHNPNRSEQPVEQLLAWSRVAVPAVMNFLFFRKCRTAVVYLGKKKVDNLRGNSSNLASSSSAATSVTADQKEGIEGANNLKIKLIRFLTNDLWPAIKVDLPDESLPAEGGAVAERLFANSDIEAFITVKSAANGRKYVKMVLRCVRNKIFFDVLMPGRETQRWEERRLHIRMLDNLESKRAIESYSDYVALFREACTFAKVHLAALESTKGELIEIRYHDEQLGFFYSTHQGYITDENSHPTYLVSPTTTNALAFSPGGAVGGTSPPLGSSLPFPDKQQLLSDSGVTDRDEDRFYRSPVNLNTNFSSDTAVAGNTFPTTQVSSHLTSPSLTPYMGSAHITSSKKGLLNKHTNTVNLHSTMGRRSYRLFEMLTRPESTSLDYKSYYSNPVGEIIEKSVNFMCGFLNSGYRRGKLVIGVHEVARKELPPMLRGPLLANDSLPAISPQLVSSGVPDKDKDAAEEDILLHNDHIQQVVVGIKLDADGIQLLESELSEQLEKCVPPIPAHFVKLDFLPVVWEAEKVVDPHVLIFYSMHPDTWGTLDAEDSLYLEEASVEPSGNEGLDGTLASSPVVTKRGKKERQLAAAAALVGKSTQKTERVKHNKRTGPPPRYPQDTFEDSEAQPSSSPQSPSLRTADDGLATDLASVAVGDSSNSQIAGKGSANTSEPPGSSPPDSHLEPQMVTARTVAGEFPMYSSDSMHPPVEANTGGGANSQKLEAMPLATRQDTATPTSGSSPHFEIKDSFYHDTRGQNGLADTARSQGATDVDSCFNVNNNTNSATPAAATPTSTNPEAPAKIKLTAVWEDAFRQRTNLSVRCLMMHDKVLCPISLADYPQLQEAICAAQLRNADLGLVASMNDPLEDRGGSGPIRKTVIKAPAPPEAVINELDEDNVPVLPPALGAARYAQCYIVVPRTLQANQTGVEAEEIPTLSLPTTGQLSGHPQRSPRSSSQEAEHSKRSGSNSRKSTSVKHDPAWHLDLLQRLKKVSLNANKRTAGIHHALVSFPDPLNYPLLHVVEMSVDSRRQVIRADVEDGEDDSGPKAESEYSNTNSFNTIYTATGSQKRARSGSNFEGVGNSASPPPRVPHVLDQFKGQFFSGWPTIPMWSLKPQRQGPLAGGIRAHSMWDITTLDTEPSAASMAANRDASVDQLIMATDSNDGLQAIGISMSADGVPATTHSSELVLASTYERTIDDFIVALPRSYAAIANAGVGRGDISSVKDTKRGTAKFHDKVILRICEFLQGEPPGLGTSGSRKLLLRTLPSAEVRAFRATCRRYDYIISLQYGLDRVTPLKENSGGEQLIALGTSPWTHSAINGLQTRFAIARISKIPLILAWVFEHIGAMPSPFPFIGATAMDASNRPHPQLIPLYYVPTMVPQRGEEMLCGGPSCGSRLAVIVLDTNDGQIKRLGAYSKKASKNGAVSVTMSVSAIVGVSLRPSKYSTSVVTRHVADCLRKQASYYLSEHSSGSGNSNPAYNSRNPSTLLTPNQLNKTDEQVQGKKPSADKPKASGYKLTSEVPNSYYTYNSEGRSQQAGAGALTSSPGGDKGTWARIGSAAMLRALSSDTSCSTGSGGGMFVRPDGGPQPQPTSSGSGDPSTKSETKSATNADATTEEGHHRTSSNSGEVDKSTYPPSVSMTPYGSYTYPTPPPDESDNHSPAKGSPEYLAAEATSTGVDDEVPALSKTYPQQQRHQSPLSGDDEDAQNAILDTMAASGRSTHRSMGPSIQGSGMRHNLIDINDSVVRVGDGYGHLARYPMRGGASRYARSVGSVDDGEAVDMTGMEAPEVTGVSTAGSHEEYAARHVPHRGMGPRSLSTIDLAAAATTHRPSMPLSSRKSVSSSLCIGGLSLGELEEEVDSPSTPTGPPKSTTPTFKEATPPGPPPPQAKLPRRQADPGRVTDTIVTGHFKIAPTADGAAGAAGGIMTPSSTPQKCPQQRAATHAGDLDHSATPSKVIHHVTISEGEHPSSASGSKGKTRAPVRTIVTASYSTAAKHTSIPSVNLLFHPQSLLPPSTELTLPLVEFAFVDRSNSIVTASGDKSQPSPTEAPVPLTAATTFYAPNQQAGTAPQKASAVNPFKALEAWSIYNLLSWLQECSERKRIHLFGHNRMWFGVFMDPFFDICPAHRRQLIPLGSVAGGGAFSDGGSVLHEVGSTSSNTNTSGSDQAVIRRCMIPCGLPSCLIETLLMQWNSD